MYVLLILESLLRELGEHMKPVTFVHTPPGAVQNYNYLSLAVLMLYYLFGGSKNLQARSNEAEDVMVVVFAEKYVL